MSRQVDVVLPRCTLPGGPASSPLARDELLVEGVQLARALEATHALGRP